MMKRKIPFIGPVAVAVCICLLSVACGKKGDTIVLGYDNTAEEAILASMLVTLIEQDSDLTVEVKGDLSGGETVLHPAIMEGEIDLYPEYTGTAWLNILKHTDIPDTDTLNAQLFQEYEEGFGLCWVGLYGFNNSYGLAVAEDVAETYGLETYSDLADVSGKLIFGAEPGFFEREDGYEGLCSTYGFDFKESLDMTFSVKYDALAEEKADVINVFTTDWRLATSGAKLLKDDKRYFPEYLCGSLVRKDTLEKYPKLKGILLQMEGMITDEDMASLNKQVETDGQEPEEVARGFLSERGLLKE